MPFVFLIFFLFSFLIIVKKSPVFSIAYFFLFLYTFFTQLGYLFYPETLALVSDGQYYGIDAFIVYWFYIFLMFVSIFLLFLFLYEKKYQLPIKIGADEPKKPRDFLYIAFTFTFQAILIFFLIKYYPDLSYINQRILKGNLLWFYLFCIDGIVLMSLFIKIIFNKKNAKNIFYCLFFLISTFLLMATGIRSGQRIEIAMTFIGFLVLLYYMIKDRIKFKKSYIKYVLLALVIFVVLSQGIRSVRGHIESPEAFWSVIKNPDTYISLFIPQNLIFQDWVYPSLTLATSIDKNLIYPSVVICSNATVLVPLIDHISLGEIVSRIINPFGVRGYGYSIITEGYNFAGFFGFIYSAFLFVFGFYLLELFFTRTNDKLFNSFMYGIMGFMIIDIVRGQSISFIKDIYLYFVPAIFLYCLMGGRVYLTVSKKLAINQPK